MIIRVSPNATVSSLPIAQRSRVAVGKKRRKNKDTEFLAQTLGTQRARTPTWSVVPEGPGSPASTRRCLSLFSQFQCRSANRQGHCFRLSLEGRCPVEFPIQPYPPGYDERAAALPRRCGSFCVLGNVRFLRQQAMADFKKQWLAAG